MGSKRTRTASTSSNGEAMVNVQKLEHIAPEFQAFIGTQGPASIIVGPDGAPSPNKPSDETVANSSSSSIPHQPWSQSTTSTTSPSKHMKKDGASPVKPGSGQKKERGSSGDSHSDKKRSSSGHHRDKHSSKPGSSLTSQGKESHQVAPTPDEQPIAKAQEDSPSKQVSVSATTASEETSLVKREDEEKRRHKDKKEDKHKKKKEKKEKKDDKERKHKSKKKSKDRDKDKERSRSSSNQLKLNIKMGTPTVSPGRTKEEQGSSQATTPSGQPAIPKIKLKLMGGSNVIVHPDSNSTSSSSSKKEKDSRKRSSSSGKIDKLEGPAAKMARVIGTDPNKEARFLEESFKKNDRKIVKPRLLPQTENK